MIRTHEQDYVDSHPVRVATLKRLAKKIIMTTVHDVCCHLTAQMIMKVPSPMAPKMLPIAREMRRQR